MIFESVSCVDLIIQAFLKIQRNFCFYKLFRKDGSGVDAAVALAEEERSYLASVLLNKLLVYLQTFKCIDL